MSFLSLILLAGPEGRTPDLQEKFPEEGTLGNSPIQEAGNGKQALPLYIKEFCLPAPEQIPNFPSTKKEADY